MTDPIKPPSQPPQQPAKPAQESGKIAGPLTSQGVSTAKKASSVWQRIGVSQPAQPGAARIGTDKVSFNTYLENLRHGTIRVTVANDQQARDAFARLPNPDTVGNFKYVQVLANTINMRKKTSGIDETVQAIQGRRGCFNAQGNFFFALTSDTRRVQIYEFDKTTNKFEAILMVTFLARDENYYQDEVVDMKFEGTRLLGQMKSGCIMTLDFSS